MESIGLCLNHAGFPKGLRVNKGENDTLQFILALEPNDECKWFDSNKIKKGSEIVGVQKFEGTTYFRLYDFNAYPFVFAPVNSAAFKGPDTNSEDLKMIAGHT